MSPESLVRDDYLNPHMRRHWHRTYTKAIQTIMNRRIQKPQRQDAWSKVAFWNFYVTSAGMTPRDRSLLTADTTTEAIVALNSVLDHLKPDGIMVWGDKVLALLPAIRLVDAANFNLDLRILKAPCGLDIMVCSVCHPSSSRFRNAKEWPRLVQFLRTLMDRKRAEGNPP